MGRAKEPVNFRLGRGYRDALRQLAESRQQPMGELIREAVQEYLEREERSAWEEEARRSARELAKAADQSDSDEAEMLHLLDTNLDEFARDWIWEDEEG